MGNIEVKKWYEILLATEDSWKPSAEDITENMYRAAERWMPHAEFTSGSTIMDVVVYLQNPRLDGMSRPLRMYDILHMCIKSREFHAVDFLLVPRERLREFLSLLAPGRQAFADPNLPELCLIQLERSFQRSYRKKAKQQP